MKNREKDVDEIIEETMKEIYDDINSSDNSEVDVSEDDSDIEIMEVDLEKELSYSAKEFFNRDSYDEAEDDEHEGGQAESDDGVDDESAGEESAADEFDDDESEEDDELDDGSADDESVDEFDDDESDDDEVDESADDEAEDESEDDESDEDESGETEEERAERRRRRKKKAGIAAGVILGVLAAVYIGFAVYFGSHFIFYTTINGTDFSMKSVAQVEEYMEKQVADYALTLEESDGGKEVINGSSISLEYVPGDELKKLVKKQNNFLWIEALWKHPEIEAAVGVKYNEEALTTEIGKLQCLVAENQTASIDAHPEFKDTEFVIVPEVIGTQIDTEKFNAAVKEAINGFQSTLNLSEAECYIKPRFFEDAPEVAAARDAMNSYLGASITYDFTPNTEVVDSTVISQWVKVDADMNVTFDQDAVKAYIASLAEKYDTLGKARQFTAANGNVVTVEGGTYGWQIDQEAEYAALTANIQNAETVTREPAYSSRAATHDAMDMGNTYVEVDITNQHMWYFQNGQVAMDTAVVTGAPTRGRSTPAGVFSILEMMRNKTLKGNIVPETGKPEYETPVAYWMRVTWSGVGFHDATWQSSFGGNRYRNGAGSHGCINMPYNQAANLYSMLSVGTPVVIHY